MRSISSLMVRAVISLLFASCALSRDVDRHSEGDLNRHGVESGSQEPGEENEYRPPAYPDEPLQDRLQKQTKVGAKKWGHENWESASMGSDEHVDLDVSAGPPWWIWLVGAAGLGVAGFVAWKLKPPWLGFIWKLIGK